MIGTNKDKSNHKKDRTSLLNTQFLSTNTGMVIMMFHIRAVNVAKIRTVPSHMELL